MGSPLWAFRVQMALILANLG